MLKIGIFGKKKISNVGRSFGVFDRTSQGGQKEPLSQDEVLAALSEADQMLRLRISPSPLFGSADSALVRGVLNDILSLLQDPESVNSLYAMVPQGFSRRNLESVKGGIGVALSRRVKKRRA